MTLPPLFMPCPAADTRVAATIIQAAADSAAVDVCVQSWWTQAFMSLG